MISPRHPSLDEVLASFVDPSPAAVELARRVAADPNVHVVATRPLTTTRLHDVYFVRAGLPTLTPALAAQFAGVAATAAAHPGEAWYTYFVDNVERRLLVFANSAGAGRFIVDLGAPG